MSKNTDQKTEGSSYLNRTLVPAFYGLHSKLTTKYSWYAKWHQNRYHKHIHYGSLGIYSAMMIALALWVGIFLPLSVSASTNTKVWNSKTDFDSGTVSNLSTSINSGHVVLDQTNTTYSESFSEDTKYDSENSDGVSWNTTDNKLTLASGDVSLSHKIVDVWGVNETINASCYDSVNNRIYYGGSKGSFGYYDGTKFVDLTSKVSAFWAANSIYAMTYDASRQTIFFVGAQGKFAKYDGTNATDLTSTISSFWSTTYIYSVSAGPGGDIYIGGVLGKFARYDGTNAINLTSIISSFWSSSSYMYSMIYDSTNSLLYMAGGGGEFAKYDGTNVTDLVSSISSVWGTSDIYSISFGSTVNDIYFGGLIGKFAIWNGSSMTNLSSNISSFWSSENIYSLVYNQTYGALFLGGGGRKLATWNGTSATNISGQISSYWRATDAIKTMSLNTNDSNVYLCGGSGRLSKTDGSSASNLTNDVKSKLKGYDVVRSIAIGNYIYFGNNVGKIARYDTSIDTLEDLTSNFYDFWGTAAVRSFAYDSSDQMLYIGGSSSRFAKFDGTTATNLYSSVSGIFGSSSINTMLYDSQADLLYAGSSFADFMKWDGANATDITSEISGFWSSSYSMNTLERNTDTGEIYLGGSFGKFAKYDEDGVAGSKATNISASISSFFGSYHIYTSVYDVDTHLLYIAGNAGKFAKYNGSSATELTSNISSAWGSSHVLTLSIKNGLLYMGGGTQTTGGGDATGPKFGSWNGISFTDLTDDIEQVYSQCETLFNIQSVSGSLYLIGSYSYGVLAKYTGGTITSGAAYTTTLDSTSTNIMSATLSATETKPEGTTITYQLSGDGGSHWEDASLDTLHSFTNAGSDLRIKISLSTTDTAVTPEITALSLSYTSLNNYTGSINLIHDGTRAVNFYSLSQSATVPTGSTLSYKVRTASTQVGLASAVWGDSIASTSLPYSLTSVTTDNQFIELQADFVSSTGLSSPDLDSLTLDYIDNDIPLIQSLSASYATDGSNNLSLSYQVKDLDTDTNPTNPNQASISFQYSTDSGNTYHDFTNSAISGTKGLTSISKSSYTTKSTIINLSTDLASQYSNTFVIKVIINDNELARNTANTTSSTMEIDTKAPSAASFKINGGSSETNTINLSSITATDDTTLTQMIISTNASFTGANYQAYSQTVSNFSATSGDTIYIKIRDSYGNQSSSVNNKVPVAVQNVIIQDLSNTSSANYRLVVGWDAQNISEVSGYRIYRKVDNGGYAEIASVPGASVNLYGDPDVDPNHTYSYKVYCTDSATNIGVESAIVSAKPAFTPTISNVSVSAAGSDRATITWTTDVACDSFVEFGIDTSYGAIQGTSSLTTTHSFTITGLNPNTEFTLRARSRDQKGTLAISESQKIKTLEEEVEVEDQTQSLPKIENVLISDVTFDSALITWDTSVVATSELQYGTQQGSYPNTIADQSPNYTTKHTIRMPNLVTGETYRYRVVGTDLIGNKYASDNYSFTTLSKPSMSNVSGVSTGSYSATVTWKTNTDTNSFVVYGVSSDKLSESFGTDDVYSIDHTVALSNLTPATTYYYKAKSTDKYGNSAYSDTKSFSTTIDTKAPEISNLRSETYLVTDESGNSKVQAIISWNTDEPSSSLIKYSEGVAASNAYTNSSPDDPALTTSHVVILASLKPSTTYHIIAISKDSSGNTATSNDYTVLTKRQEKSITQIIVQILEENFSWLKKLKIL